MNQYNENIQKVVDNLVGDVRECIPPTALVPGVQKLQEAGNNLYIDESGVLRAVPVGYAESVLRFTKDLVAESTVDSYNEGIIRDTSASLV